MTRRAVSARPYGPDIVRHVVSRLITQRRGFILRFDDAASGIGILLAPDLGRREGQPEHRDGEAGAAAGDGAAGRGHGRAVQVDPIKPTVKAPGIKLVKVKCDEPLSNFVYKLNLRRYTMVTAEAACDELAELLGELGG